MDRSGERRINYAEAVAPRSALLVWRDVQAAATIDLGALLASDRRLARVRRDPALFGTLRAKADGSGLRWADGSELAAAAIAAEPDPAMSNAEFRAAMEVLGESLESMALRLKLSRRLIADYRADKPVPPTVVYALRYLTNRR